MFVAHEVSNELIQELRPLVPAIAREDRVLADQLRRSATSVLLNLGECARPKGGDMQRDRTWQCE